MASSDPPEDPEPGAVVDPEVLAERRARREDPSAQAEVERLRAAQSLAERRNAELEAEVVLLTGEVDRRVAEHAAVTSQVARLRAALTTLRARAGTEQAHQAATTAVLEELRVGQLQVEHELEQLRAERDRVLLRLEEERARRDAAELLVAEERARFAVERSAAEFAARAEREELAAQLAAAQQAVAALEAGVADAGRAVSERRAGDEDRARAEGASREQRDQAVERLVGDLVGTVEGLRAGFLAELERLEAERAALELAGSGADAAGQAARLRDEVARLRSVAGPIPSLYDRPAGGAEVPSADHPALAGTPHGRPDAPPPAVVGDLDRAAARLRAAHDGAEADASSRRPSAALAALFASTMPPEGAEAEELAPDAPTVVETPARAEGADVAPPQPDRPAREPDGPPARVDAPPARSGASGSPPPLGVIHATAPTTATTAPWLREALADLAAADDAAAERMLLAALAVQAERASDDVAYELELPVSGRHHVEVLVGRSVTVRPLSPGDRPRSEFRLAGASADLAPLVAGAAPARLGGVRVRGRRRRLKRLLKALQPVVGLPELRSAGAHPEPADLLELLCAHVPRSATAEAELRIAYLVADRTRPPVRVVVQARKGSVAVDRHAGREGAVDATVSVEPRQLLGVLAGTEPALVEGDQAAVATLHGWFRAAQELSA